MDPQGFGVWSDDCTRIAVVVNKADWNSRLFMSHEINQRYDLYLCDFEGNIIRQIFSSRKINGIESSVESLIYNKSENYIIVETLLYGTGRRQIEKISTIDDKIEIIDLDLSSHSNKYLCSGKIISWNQSTKWIEIKNN